LKPRDSGSVAMCDHSATESKHWLNKSLEILCKQNVKFLIRMYHEEQKKKKKSKKKEKEEGRMEIEKQNKYITHNLNY
jgi:beta-lactamase class D